MPTDHEQESAVALPIVAEPLNVAEFNQMLFELGIADRQIEAIDNERNRRVAEIDAQVAIQRRPLVDSFNAKLAACLQFASEPKNKELLTKGSSPQRAELDHGVVKWFDDHTGSIKLQDGITEEQAIRALLHRKGGSAFVKTTRSIRWSMLNKQQPFVLAMRHFRRVFSPRVELYAKPARSPKPTGRAAEKQLKPR